MTRHHILSLLILIAVQAAYALPVEFYATNSRLATGRWAKIEVTETGMQFISNAALKQLGFSDPSKVQVYGYGGRVLSEKLNSDNPDDLAPIAIERTSGGIVFFGHNTVSWTFSDVKTRKYEHTLNPYGTASYYFISDKDTEAYDIKTRQEVTANNPEALTTFTEHLLHEQDLMSPGETGRLFLGEDFRSQPVRSFNFQLPGNTGDASVTVSFGTKVTNGSSTLAFTANGQELPASSTDRISGATNSESFITTANTTKTVTAPGEKLAFQISYSTTGAVFTAALNFIQVEYERELKLTDRDLHFELNATQSRPVSIDGCSQETVLWDVTDPLSVSRVDMAVSGSTGSFVTPAGHREYAVFNPAKVNRAVKPAGLVPNQDIHGLETPDMVIITPEIYRQQAERLADIHRTHDGFKVAVVTPEAVYNEFSSGTADVTAMRKMLKMWHDRGLNQEGVKTRYCLIMSRGSYDPRMVTAAARNAGYPRVPMWQSPTGTTESSSYSTDDYIGMLDDNDKSLNLSTATIHVGVGRLPVKSLAEATAAVDKIENYILNPTLGSWRSNVMLIADDQDNGEHLAQAESAIEAMLANPKGHDLVYEKVYLDSYPLVMSATGATYPGAHDRMIAKMSEGTAYINYIGHANAREWGHEQLLTWTDIMEMQNTNLPFIYAATCSFLQWDADAVSGGEELWLNPDGIIGMICPSRKVFIALNGALNDNISRHLTTTGADGKTPRIGDAVRIGKSQTVNDANKLRYCLMGDPAMRLPFASMTAVVDRIGGQPVDGEAPVLGARDRTTVSGYITGADGELAADFNGYVQLQLYDAEKAITTLGNGSDGKVDVYNDRKTRLFIGRAKVEGGKWEAELIVPSEIENNYSPALIAMHACADDGREANGHSTGLYVYGFSANAAEDNEGPQISEYYLNDAWFSDGDAVGPTPTAYATFSDPSGINLSDAGIGHKMSMTLDGTKYIDDVSLYYEPDMSSTNGGKIAYPLPSIEPGEHTLDLTVWDTANNSTTRRLTFNIRAGWHPGVSSFTTDGGPASSSVNFIVTTDGAEKGTGCTVEVYDLSGRRQWMGTSAVSGNNVRIPWNLTDNAGKRVPRGIYLCRATVTSAQGAESKATLKLAVTAK